MKSYSVFLSAVSDEFESARNQIASDIRSRGLHVRTQSDFRQELGSQTLLEKLHNYIRDCDAVICIVGNRSGSYPPKTAEFLPMDFLPNGAEFASYTQWELHFARHFGKRLSIYRATEEWISDQNPGKDNDSDQQAEFLAWIEATNLDWTPFSTIDQLARQILKEVWPDCRSKRPCILESSIGELFVGRENAIDEIREYFETKSPKPLVLAGLGGVGKTRCAVEFVHRYIPNSVARLQINANSPKILDSNLAKLAGSSFFDLPEQAQSDLEPRIAAVVSHLSSTKDWCLILDNVDTERAAKASQDRLSEIAGGQVLITARVSNWGPSFQILYLDEFSQKESTNFLLSRTRLGRRKSSRDFLAAQELSEKLGGLALALEQAGAYINDRRISFDSYIQKLKEQPEKLLDTINTRISAYHASVARTWFVSFDELSPWARHLLGILSNFAPDPLPRSMFEGLYSTPISKISDPACKGSSSVPTRVEFEDSLAELRSLSLISFSGDSVTIHKLLQEIVRLLLGEDFQHYWEQAVSMISGWAPTNGEDIATWDRWTVLEPHVHSLLIASEKFRDPEPIPELLGGLAAFWSFAHGNHRLAGPLLKRALESRKANLRADHPATLSALNNLGVHYMCMGNYEEAEPLLRQVLEVRETSLPLDHVDLAESLNNLGWAMKGVGGYREAETHLRRCLKLRKESLGKEDLRTMAVAHNLAQLLSRKGDTHEAHQLFVRVLEVRRKELGAKHPDTLRTLTGYAAFHADRDDHQTALELLREARVGFEDRFDKTHPETLGVIWWIAGITEKVGEFTQALEDYEFALHGWEAKFGKDNPNSRKLRKDRDICLAKIRASEAVLD